MQGQPTASTDGTYNIGHRYLNGKTRHSLTLRYIGPLPPSSGPTALATSSQIWYGVEYDDPSNGKGHSVGVFSTRRNGAGAFLKAGKEGVLIKGKTFVEAVEERYGSIIPHAECSTPVTPKDKLILGSSNAGILVEAPNIGAVQTRLGRLERLRHIGLEGEWVNELGGDDETRKVLRERLRGELQCEGDRVLIGRANRFRHRAAESITEPAGYMGRCRRHRGMPAWVTDPRTQVHLPFRPLMPD